jgi:hypothetical protein
MVSPYTVVYMLDAEGHPEMIETPEEIQRAVLGLKDRESRVVLRTPAEGGEVQTLLLVIPEGWSPSGLPLLFLTEVVGRPDIAEGWRAGPASRHQALAYHQGVAFMLRGTPDPNGRTAYDLVGDLDA